MKKDEIVVGGTYSDGKNGQRRVLAEGGKYRLYDSQADGDCLLYEHVSGKWPPLPRGRSARGQPLMHCTRISFAAWAKERLDVAGEELPLPEKKRPRPGP